MNKRALRILAPAGVLAFGIVLWDLVVRINGIPPYILPSPGPGVDDARFRLGVAARYAGDHDEGLLLAVVGGAVGSRSPSTIAADRALALSLRGHSSGDAVVAVAPLLLIYLPQQAAVLACAWIHAAFFPVLANTTLGLNSVVQPRDLFALRAPAGAL